MRFAMFRDGSARLLVFRVGGERFAVELVLVDEVIDTPSVQPIPDAPETVHGVATVRGELVTIYDPHPVLHVKGRIGGTALLFARNGRRVALLVDDVYDAMTMAEEELLRTPGGASSAADGILVGLIRRDGELIALLDADALLDAVAAGDGERT
jgi:purine-binding chemotaxis protein CheW